MKSQAPNYHGYRFPPEIISHADWLSHRFGLSFRDAEDLLAQRAITVTYETIRQWCRTFGPAYARTLRRCGRMGDTWYLDELFVTIRGRQQYLWRAVDEDGDVLDILVQSRRNRHAAVRFFRKLLKRQGGVPRRLVTDKLRSYPAACRMVMPSVVHCTEQYANNRAEVSHQATHQATRQRERQMRRFKSAAQLQRFASVHGVVQTLFRVGRHLLRSAHHRLLRGRAFVEWDAVTCVC
jgi:putative transposase